MNKLIEALEEMIIHALENDLHGGILDRAKAALTHPNPTTMNYPALITIIICIIAAWIWIFYEGYTAPI